MTLAHMINLDEDALICDLAETYGVYDYRSLPCKTAAAFSYGLRDDSRIKKEMAGTSATVEQMLLAAVVDNTRMIAWLQSEDGSKGQNRPKSLLADLIGETENRDLVRFDSGEEFDAEWKRLAEGGQK